jgi:hypothetical protein
MRLVLQRFKEEGLKLRLKKCFFGLQEMEYLGFTVSTGKISVSTKKVEAVADWPVPTTQKEVRSFVEFCNFYARFIHHFSELTAPLTDLLRKSQPHKVTLTVYISLRRTTNGHICTLDSGGVLALHL